MNHLDIIKAYHTAIWDRKDLNAIDQFFHKDALIHSPVKTTQGTQEMKSVIAQWHKGLPNLKVHWHDFISEGDKVVVRWQAEGIHEGEFLGKQPSNKKISYSGVTIYQLSDEKISQYWAFIDMAHLSELIASQ